jgi:hypothetical protein
MEALKKEIEKLKVSAPNSQKLKKLIREKRDAEMSKHRDSCRPSFVRLGPTEVFVPPEQANPEEVVFHLRTVSQGPGLWKTMKDKAALISAHTTLVSRELEFNAFTVDLARMLGLDELDPNLSKVLLRISEIIQRLFEAHGMLDDAHKRVIFERLTYILDTKYALSCLVAVEMFCQEHFLLFLELVNQHPTARRTAVLAKPTVVKAGVAVVIPTVTYAGGGAAVTSPVACAGGGARKPKQRHVVCISSNTDVSSAPPPFFELETVAGKCFYYKKREDAEVAARLFNTSLLEGEPLAKANLLANESYLTAIAQRAKHTKDN